MKSEQKLGEGGEGASSVDLWGRTNIKSYKLAWYLKAEQRAQSHWGNEGVEVIRKCGQRIIMWGLDGAGYCGEIKTLHFGVRSDMTLHLKGTSAFCVKNPFL